MRSHWAREGPKSNDHCPCEMRESHTGSHVRRGKDWGDESNAKELTARIGAAGSWQGWRTLLAGAEDPPRAHSGCMTARLHLDVGLLACSQGRLQLLLTPSDCSINLLRSQEWLQLPWLQLALIH